MIPLFLDSPFLCCPLDLDKMTVLCLWVRAIITLTCPALPPQYLRLADGSGLLILTHSVLIYLKAMLCLDIRGHKKFSRVVDFFCKELIILTDLIG